MDFQAPKGRNLLHPFLFLSFIQVLAVNWDDLRLSISRKYKTEVQEVLEQGNMVNN
jgi:hypothetical protein